MIKYLWPILTLVLLGSFLSERALHSSISDYEPELPEGFPIPVYPDNNKMTANRIELGRMLFYDPILSIDSTVSCSSCHKQELAFADNKVISPGVGNSLAMRNAPTLTNVAYNKTYLFDAFLESLEKQVIVPIQEHAEMDHNLLEVVRRLRKDSLYSRLSWEAYDRKIDAFVLTRAISAFQRTLISGNSKFDQQVFQKKDVMSKSEKRGMNLFMNKLHCTTCHSGFNFTNYTPQNNGLYIAYLDTGRQRVTKLIADRALFKVPTLRNIALTAPYMHDGNFKSLNEVIAHYEQGGKNHPNKNKVLQPFKLSVRQRKDLIAFLNTLTDFDFISNPAFSSPFKDQE